MDCEPLNLAHFHERRSDRFLRHHRYDDAMKALETSLIYLQDAYKVVNIPKSIEILNIQRWAFERKLRQIEIRKTQYGQSKIKDFSSLKETSPPMLPLRPESGGSAQSVAKAIDKTVQDFDAKFISTMQKQRKGSGGGSRGETMRRESLALLKQAHLTQAMMTKSEPQVTQPVDCQQYKHGEYINEGELSLAPLELPPFDFNMFTSSSAPSLASFAGIQEKENQQ